MTHELSKTYKYPETEIEAFKKFLTDHTHFLFLGPKIADGDTIGANTAMAMFIVEQMGKKVTLYNPSPVEKMYKDLPWADKYVTDFDPSTIDAVFISDTGDKRLFANTPAEQKLFERDLPVVNLDHHISNQFYGTINLVDLNKASSSLIVFELLKKLRAKITPDMATHLLLGMYFDTGSMYHPNTTAEVYENGAELISLGAKPRDIVDPLYKTMDFGKLKLIGLVLERASLYQDGMLMSAIRQEDLIACNATRDDLEGVVDYLFYAPEARFGMLLIEDEKGNVKGSLRTQRDDVDVSKIAETFGGGGHRAAAGFTIQGHRLEMEVKWKIAPRVAVLA
ncbi:MAG: DHH family phosphoesterase [Candidatus Gracilibacteria bacterium]